MTDGLKECPFCGGEDVFQYVDPHDITYTWEGWTVITECECGAKVRGRAKTEKQAYKASSKKWNHRYRRTCKPVKHESGDVHCSLCGHVLYTDFDPVAKVVVWEPYCPSCGAEVVDGD